ncbi:MAG: 23S rRNA (pseudouridine(1915)-N(3))-methyltransferase RlmH [Blastochloris sp.]|nr:23S rRNA (pseudouridine(1915)-N(3))-methyltransferase RlmH [Blastochloris sp.]
MPKFRIITVGKPKLAYAKLGAEEYLGRLKHMLPVEWKTVKAGAQKDEGEQLLKASEGWHRVVLDERGRSWGSRELASILEDWDMNAVKEVAILIGGAEGHGPALKAKADVLWSLGKATLQHELALVVLLEQLYRAQTIRRGEPYHRD